MLAGDAETAASALDGLELDGGPEDADILLVRGQGRVLPSATWTPPRRPPRPRSGSSGGRARLEGARPGDAAGDGRARRGRVVDRLRRELTPHPGEPGGRQHGLRGLAVRRRVPALRPDPVPRGDRRRPGPAGHRPPQRRAARRGVRRRRWSARPRCCPATSRSPRPSSRGRGPTHRELGSSGGEAHALQRLAEVHLARGERETAARLAAEALPLARESPLARHLLHRVFGTMIGAADDPAGARAVVERADVLLGVDDRCAFCSIMFLVPAAIACARVGESRTRRACWTRRGAARNCGRARPGWPRSGRSRARIAEARGDEPAAHAHLVRAAEAFERAGQPLDAHRCRDAAGKDRGRIGS